MSEPIIRNPLSLNDDALGENYEPTKREYRLIHPLDLFTKLNKLPTSELIAGGYTPCDKITLEYPDGVANIGEALELDGVTYIPVSCAPFNI